MCLSTVYTQVTHILRYSLFFSKKVTFSDIIVVENFFKKMPNKITAVLERYLAIRNVSERGFID